MKIGELARVSGLTHSRIRFYERIGLLKAVERRPNGYRAYPSEAVLMLDLIATAQNAGFSLDEIRGLLPPDLTSWRHGTLVETLRRKIDDIGTLQKRLARSKANLVALLKEIEGKPEGIDCATNARRVLSQLQGGKIKKPALAVGDVRLLGKVSRRRQEAKAR